MSNINRIPILLTAMFAASLLHAQTRLTEKEAIGIAMSRSPLIKAAALQVSSREQTRGTAFNLANPDFTMESPSGEFMTAGVLQSFKSPTVYIRQGQLFRQLVVLAEKEKLIAETEFKMQVAAAYLDLQYSLAVWKNLRILDSLYSSMAASASRKFAAGEINFVAKTYASTASGEIHNQFLRSKSDAKSALQKLQIYTGISDSIVVVPLEKTGITSFSVPSFSDTISAAFSPVLQYQEQLMNVARKSLQLERQKAIPGFTIGYINQGAANTPSSLRVRAGINIPVWFWQYASAIQAAKTNLEISDQNMIARQQELQYLFQKTENDIRNYRETLAWYEQDGLKQAGDLISAAEKMFDACVSDFVSVLQTRSDAWEIKKNYLDTILKYNLSVIQWNSLLGQL